MIVITIKTRIEYEKETIILRNGFIVLDCCESGMNEFSDFDYQTVYFANQYAERTLELGEDEFVDNSIDNEHKVSIKAAWGGGYTNRENVIIDFIVDESLCDNLYFLGTDTPVMNRFVTISIFQGLTLL